jgi:hypothetical protein
VQKERAHKEGLSRPKKNKDGENEGSSKSMNIVEDNLDDADGVMLSVASNLEHPMDSWILDSACSFLCEAQLRLV